MYLFHHCVCYHVFDEALTKDYKPRRSLECAWLSRNEVMVSVLGHQELRA
ncbi:hypothetical protein Hanom_Chr10g00956491 [Helianthus anomalus]